MVNCCKCPGCPNVITCANNSNAEWIKFALLGILFIFLFIAVLFTAASISQWIDLYFFSKKLSVLKESGISLGLVGDEITKIIREFKKG